MKPLKLDNLVNAVKMSILHPDTFEVPSFEDISAVQPGDFVKICLESEDDAERFWCEVKNIDVAKRIIHAEVANCLIYFDYEPGTLLEIKFDEVYNILEKQDA